MRTAAKKKKLPKINSMVELVSATFEDGKSMRSGYANVGISFDPNQSVSANADRLSAQGIIPTRKELRELDVDAKDLVVPEDTEMGSWKELMEVPDVQAKGRNVFLAPFERAYWQRLIAKHGNNYIAMARDIKLNNYQHTARVCEKKCALFEQKYNDDLSRKERAVHKKDARKQAAAERRKNQPMPAAKEVEEEDSESQESQSQSQEENDMLESLSDFSDLEEVEDDGSISSDEEEFAPPPKKKFVSSAPQKPSSKPVSKKNVKSK